MGTKRAISLIIVVFAGSVLTGCSSQLTRAWLGLGHVSSEMRSFARKRYSHKVFRCHTRGD